MEAGQPVYVETGVVDCDGGALGHPNVALRIGADGEVVCPYCSRRFILAGETEGAVEN